MIIGLAGKMGSGKNTLADKIGLPTYAFADKLKEITKELFHVDTVNKTPRTREILQKVGQCMREIEPLVWVNYLINKLRIVNWKCVITDVRYVNEAESILKADGRVFYLDVLDTTRRERINKRDGVITDQQWNAWLQHPSEYECEYIRRIPEVIILNANEPIETVYRQFLTELNA